MTFDDTYGQPAPTWRMGEAFFEGWEIFECDRDGYGVLEIQRLDDPAAVGLPPNPVFAGDAEAVAFVKRRAEAGSDMHRRAITLHLMRTWEG